MKMAVDLKGKAISGLSGVMGVKNSFGQKLSQCGYQKKLNNYKEIEVDTSTIQGTEKHCVIPESLYLSLQEQSLKLDKLEAYGVGNWSGYGIALSDEEEIFCE